MPTVAEFIVKIGAEISDLENKISASGRQMQELGQKAAGQAAASFTSNINSTSGAMGRFSVGIKEMAGMASSKMAQINASISNMANYFKTQSDSVIAKTKTVGDAWNKLASSPLSSVAGSIATGFAVVGAAMGAAGGYALKLAGEMEQTKTAFVTLTGSAGAADKTIKDLVKFAAKTPFEQKGLLDSTRKLITFGMTADKATNTTKTLANAVAAAGGSSADLEGVATAVGQIQAKGKLSMEEILQLSERGIPALDMVAKGLNMTTGELMAQMQKGAVSSDKAIGALLQGIDTRFKGAAEAQSNTFLGQMNNLKDNVGIVMTGIGQSIINAFNLTGVLKNINDLIGKFQDVYEKTGSLRKALDQLIPPGLQIALVAIAGIMAGIMVAALVALAPLIWGVVAATGAWLLSMAPIILIVMAVAVAAFLIIKYWDEVVNFFTKTIPAAAQVVIDWFKALPENIVTFLSELPGMAAYWLGFMIGTIIKWVSDGVTNTIAYFASLPDRVANEFNLMKMYAGRIIFDMVQGVIKIANGLPDFFSNLWNNILDFLTGLPSRMAQAALSIASNFWDGIKKGLDIGSPSNVERAFMAISNQAQTTIDDLNRLKPKFSTTMDIITQPMAGAAPSTTNPAQAYQGIMGGGNVTNNFYIDELAVREEADIDRIAEKLNRLQQPRSRGRSGVSV